MKRLICILAVVFAFGILITGCNTDSGDGNNNSREKTITITGLNNYNGSAILVGLLPSDNIFDLILSVDPETPGNGILEAWGMSAVFNNRASNIPLLSVENIPWSGSGLWHVGLIFPIIEEDFSGDFSDLTGIDIYISNNRVNFNSSPSVGFSGFKKYAPSITAGDITEMIGVEFPEEGITLNEIVFVYTDGELNYDDLVEEMGYVLFKDAEFSDPFSGDDVIYAETVIYADLTKLIRI